MVKKSDKEIELRTPLSESDVRSLELGDVAYITGIIYTLRDRGHLRLLNIVQKGEKPPIDLKGSVIFHAGPICKQESGKWEIVVIGPTASPRMTPYVDFMCKQGVKGMMGLGGFDIAASTMLQKYGAVYLAAIGGTAVHYGRQVKRIVRVDWLDLGMPDAIWHLEVERFGPVVVAMDSKGNNSYENVFKEGLRRLPKLYQELGITKEYYNLGSLHGYKSWEFGK